jgi:hypothetical protein
LAQPSVARGGINNCWTSIRKRATLRGMNKALKALRVTAARKLIERQDAIAAGVPASAIQPLDDAIAIEAVAHLPASNPLRQVASVLHAYGTTVVADAWVETSLGSDWVAALRLTLQRGTLVIAEVRVFPDEPKRRHLGRWSAEWRGSAAPVPKGGLRMRLLRKLSWGPPMEWARHAAAAFRKTSTPEMFAAFYGEETIRPPRGKEPRPGRPPMADEYVAKVAKAYAEALKPGTRPNKKVAADLAISPGRVATIVFEARKRGFLSPARYRGQPGGSLTPLGSKIAAKAARQETRRRARTTKPRKARTRP